MKKVFLENMDIDGFGKLYIAPVTGYEVLYNGKFVGNEFATKSNDASASIIDRRILSASQYERVKLDASKFTVNKFPAWVVWQEVYPGGASQAQFVIGGGCNRLKNKKEIPGKGPGKCHDEALAYNLGSSNKKPTNFDLTALIGPHDVVTRDLL